MDAAIIIIFSGGHVKFIVLPDMLKNAPMFKKVQNMKRAKPGLQISIACLFSLFVLSIPFPTSLTFL